MVNMAKRVYEKIDMTVHTGGHPRMGALDVVPFVPVSGVTVEECVKIAKEVGEKIGECCNVPVYLYEDAATTPERQNLATVRKGQYEGFFEKIKQPEWKPDFGPCEMNVKGGCVAVGVRFPLIAYNVNLGTDNLDIANNISKAIRHIGGGLRFVKAMGVKIEEKNIVQVSMNLANYEKTAVYRAFEMVKMEAKRYGVSVVGSEVIGLIPMAALIHCAEYYLQLENFSMESDLRKENLGINIMMLDRLKLKRQLVIVQTVIKEEAILNILIKNISNLVTCKGSYAKTKEDLKDAGIINDGYVFIKDNIIEEVGSGEDFKKYLNEADTVIDGTGKTVTPGLVDSHTHIVYAGSREMELPLKLQNVSYIEILNAGGGILSTVENTRTASKDELIEGAKKDWI